MKDKVSTNEYKKWIMNIFSTVMMRGTMDGYFKMFKHMIVILLKNNKKHQQYQDWKCFVKSKIIDQNLVIQVEHKINDPINYRDMVDNKWCVLLKTMIDSFEDPSLLEKYIDETKSDSKESEKNDIGDYYCNKNHLMVEIRNGNYDKKQRNSVNSRDTSAIYECRCCDLLRDANVISLECIECDEYICQECVKNVIELDHHLKSEGFKQFERMMNEYTKTKQQKMIKQVELSVYINSQ